MCGGDEGEWVTASDGGPGSRGDWALQRWLAKKVMAAVMHD